MRKMLTFSALALSVMLVASSSQAAQNEYVKTYTGGPAAISFIASPPPPVGTPLGDFGGATFSNTDGLPVSVTFADATGGIAAWTVAQDLNANLIIEPGLEPSVSGCGNGGSLAGTAIPFQAGAPVGVWLRSVGRLDRAAATFTPCEGVVTNGTITLTTIVD